MHFIPSGCIGYTNKTRGEKITRRKDTRHVSDTWKCGSLSFIFTGPPEHLKKKKEKRKKKQEKGSRQASPVGSSKRDDRKRWDYSTYSVGRHMKQPGVMLGFV